MLYHSKTSSKTVASMISEVSHVPSGFGDLAEVILNLAPKICLLILKELNNNNKRESLSKSTGKKIITLYKKWNS